jgi:hypothetical protein
VLLAPQSVSDSQQHSSSLTYTIDPSHDRLIALATFPRWHEERTGRRIHRTLPYQWRSRGVLATDGTVRRLPTIRIGGVRYTSEEAIAWWTAAINGSASA